MKPSRETEWIETDGRGGFISGTTSGVRTRRYHALLLTATAPPTQRCALVQGMEAWVEMDGGQIPISTQHYAPDVFHPDGQNRIHSFEPEPWPTWRYKLSKSLDVQHEIVLDRAEGATILRWALTSKRRTKPVLLHVRLLLSGRDHHALHRENPAFRFESEIAGAAVKWTPYEGVPAIRAAANGEYFHSPDWYRRFCYAKEKERGFEGVEDLASPGVFTFDLAQGPAVLLLEALPANKRCAPASAESVVRDGEAARERERERRNAAGGALDRAADIYIVERGRGKSIIAGYPWFTDWGRDTFIALRGLCLARGRFEEAHAILREWAQTLDAGMIPNRFPERGAAPEFNAVDASLWFVVAAGEFLALTADASSGGKASAKAGAAPGDKVGATSFAISNAESKRLREVCLEIVTSYHGGTRHRIGCDDDGLLKAGEDGQQLTWMDAKVGGQVITPRVGKPVGVQALWVNALETAGAWDASWAAAAEKARANFVPKFWNEETQCCFDVVDVDHQPGINDASIRPNQIFAVGGLPSSLLEGEKARAVVDRVERDLWTPVGLRTLSPAEPAYRGRYEGSPESRDASYHQGTVWPWLLGAFVEAWVRVRGNTPAAKKEARRKFFAPLLLHLEEAGLGHLSEIYDGDEPHTPRGCPFQAWSLAELIRMDRNILSAARTRRSA